MTKKNHTPDKAKRIILDYTMSQQMSDRILDAIDQDRQGRFIDLEKLEEELHEKQNEQDLQDDNDDNHP